MFVNLWRWFPVVIRIHIENIDDFSSSATECCLWEQKVGVLILCSAISNMYQIATCTSKLAWSGFSIVCQCSHVVPMVRIGPLQSFLVIPVTYNSNQARWLASHQRQLKGTNVLHLYQQFMPICLVQLLFFIRFILSNASLYYMTYTESSLCKTNRNNLLLYGRHFACFWFEMDSMSVMKYLKW